MCVCVPGCLRPEAEAPPLTGAGGCVVGGVGPQVLGGVCGRLRQTLGAAAVAHAAQKHRDRRRSGLDGTISSRTADTHLSATSTRLML